MGKTIIIVISCAIGCALLLLLLLLLLLPIRQTEMSAKNNNNNRNETYYTMEGTPTTTGSTTSPVPVFLYPAVSSTPHQELLLLHRQKRYLVFPEGSSFQLVFDLIIPIVDYTNFAILGITCAVAWELPSKPPSELLENLRTRLNDGTLGTVRRNDTVQQEYNSSYNRTATNWQAMHAPAPAPPPAAASAPARASAPAAVPEPSTYAANVHSYSYYTNVPSGDGGGTSVYANSPNGEQRPGWPTNWHARQSIPKWRQWAAEPPSPPAFVPASAPSPQSAVGSDDRWSDNWWLRNKERVQQNWRERQQQWSNYGQTAARGYDYPERPRQVLQKPPKHYIYPVFGKRRRRRGLERQRDISDDAIECLHLRQHLSSRALLFGKIERLYRSRELNGTACIQRALCESAQRQEISGQQKPQSFIMELLSAIFQLPSGTEASGETADHIAPHYLEAHRQRGNCRRLYGDCSHTFWL